jgi:prepilin-type processing-associated H-X9-DG protein
MSVVTRNSRIMTCQANEKNICQAIFAYAASNSGVLPVPSIIGETDVYGCWNVPTGGTADFDHGTLWPYLASTAAARQKVMKCPADDNECLPSAGGDSYFPPGNFSYSLNALIRWNWFRPSSLDIPLSLALRQVKSPSTHGMVFEEFAPNDGLCCGPGDTADYFTGRHGPNGTSDFRPNYYQAEWSASGRGNCGFFDGHVECIPTSDYQNNTNDLWGPIE